MADLNRQGDTEINIVDKISQVSAQVDASGNLKVVNPTPAPPAGTTAVNEGSIVTPNKNGGTSQINYVVPNGKTLFTQRFSGGSEAVEAKFTLYWQPNGNTTGEILIKVAFLDNDNFQFDLNGEYVGDGTGRLAMIATNNTSKNGLEFAMFVDGYLEDT